MQQYLNLVKTIKQIGRFKTDRTGTGVISLFGTHMRFNLADGFPLMTTKKLHVKSIVHELIWILSGSTNIKYLQDNGVKIWDEWATADGELGPVYGHQLRKWPGEVTYTEHDGTLKKLSPDGEIYTDTCNGHYNDMGVVKQESIDQMQILLDNLRKDPFSRRHVVTMWNPAVLPDTSVSPSENAANGKQALPACHAFFQFYCDEADIFERAAFGGDKNFLTKFFELRGQTNADIHKHFDDLGIPRIRLSCQLYQRSVDIFLGCPFNIASYALLTHMVAHQLDYLVGDFVWTGGDTHLYSNHVEQADLQLTREPLPLPTLKFLRKPNSIFEYKFEDIEFENYVSHDTIKAKVAV